MRHYEPPVKAPFLKGEDSLCVNDWWNRPRLVKKLEVTNLQGLTGRPEGCADAVAWVDSAR